MKFTILKIWTSELTELTDELKRINSVDRSQSDGFVFKTNKEIIFKLEKNESVRIEIIARALRKKVYLIIYNLKSQKYKIYRVKKDGVNEETQTSLLDSIRSSDLNEVVTRSDGDCLIDAPENGHFITPSGKHSIQFLRLSDALFSYGVLDRVSYWLQPYVASSAAVIIDTWSLSSLILKTQQLVKNELPFECFREHVNASEELAIKVLNKLSKRIRSNKKILFLVSISSSGTFFNAIPELVNQSKIKNQFINLSIFGFQNPPANVDVLSKLEFDIEWFDKHNCIYCKSEDRNTTYEIDSKYYFPRRYEEKAIRFSAALLNNIEMLKNGQFDPLEPAIFIQEYGKHKGVLVVHRNDLNDKINPRHHSYYIDVTKLFEINKFLSEFNDKLDLIENDYGIPDLIVAPPHDAATNIIENLKRKWFDVSIIRSENLQVLNTDEKHLIMHARRMCMIDDVTITGTRINQYLRALREGFTELELSNLKSITWFPLIARPDSESVIASITDSLSHHTGWINNFIYMYFVILPNWSSEKECPWCREASIFQRHIKPSWNQPQWYVERQLKLADKENGIVELPLLSAPVSEPKTLGSGSPLGEQGLTEIQVIFLLAHGLQKLRTSESGQLGRDNLLQRNVLYWNLHNDKKCNTFERYTEPLIQKAFLRTVKINEWSKLVKQNGTTYLSEQITGKTHDDLIMEALLFLLRIENRKVLPIAVTNRIKEITDDKIINSIIEVFNK